MSTLAKQVLSFGETLIDLIATNAANGLEDATAFVARPGGAPANVVVALSRLGVPSAFCGVVGDDPFAAKLRRALSADGVDLSRLRSTNEADTTLAFAWKDARGDGHFRLLRMADRLLDLNDIETARIEEAEAIVVGSVALAADPSRRAVTRAVEIAAESGVPVCFDVNMRPTLWPDATAAREACAPILERATLLKLSLDDAAFLFGAGIEADHALFRAARSGAQFAVLTDGARGAWFTSAGIDGEDTFVPSFAVDAIEPTGAGDSFNAAIISCLIARQWTELRRNDIKFAAAAGALTTTRRGAIEALPTRAEIEAFLAAR
jgi:fructokinase